MSYRTVETLLRRQPDLLAEDDSTAAELLDAEGVEEYCRDRGIDCEPRNE